jgi:hypothetical protein
MHRQTPTNNLLRGGFRIGKAPGLPELSSYSLEVGEAFGFVSQSCIASVRLTWQQQASRRFVQPGLARETIAGASHVHLAQTVLRVWLSYLIEHAETLPDGLMWGIQSMIKIKSHQEEVFYLASELWDSWLEQYNAYTLYRLARQGWRDELQLNHVEEGADIDEVLSQWESGLGDPLPLNADASFTLFIPLYANLLSLVLPRVATLQIDNMGEERVKPPEPGWRETLQHCHDFISAPVEWPTLGSVAEFADDIAHLIYTTSSGMLGFWNQRFQDRLASFSDDELRELGWLLGGLPRSLPHMGEQLEITREEAALLRRAQAAFGDLEICIEDQSWRLNSFDIPDEEEQ